MALAVFPTAVIKQVAVRIKSRGKSGVLPALPLCHQHRSVCTADAHPGAFLFAAYNAAAIAQAALPVKEGHLLSGLSLHPAGNVQGMIPFPEGNTQAILFVIPPEARIA